MILPDLITRWDELILTLKPNSLKFVDWKYIAQKFDILVNFLKRKPELWMFIPCGEDGLPLDHPEIGRDKDYDSNDTSIESIIYHEKLHKSLKEYQEAQARCLFSGFVFSQDYFVTSFCGYLEFGKYFLAVYWDEDKWTFEDEDENGIKTIADLCRKVELTPEGEKQAGII